MTYETDFKATKLNAYNEAHLADPRNEIVFEDAATGVKACKFFNEPAARVAYYVIHPRNGTRTYEDKKGAVSAAKGMVKRWDNEAKYWERQYNL